MSYVTSEQMLEAARLGGYAVGAFNAENMEMVQAIVAAAEELRAPVMIQTTPGTLRYAPPAMFAAMVRTAAEAVSVPVCLHLDHGSSFGLCARSIRDGYGSVMIDGSALSFEENVALTKKVTEMAEACGIPVEAELGRVGGKEDDTESDGCGYTDPAEAAEFVLRTGVTSLAIGVGTAHGFYTEKPVLNVRRVSECREAVEVPLVLHGASGLSDEDVRECIRRGISKVNFATELRNAYLQAVRRAVSADPGLYDPKKIGAPAMAAVKEQVMCRIKVCGCDGKG